MSAPPPQRRSHWRALVYIGGGLIVGALVVTPSLGYKQEWQLVVPLVGALLGALVYRWSARGSRPEPPQSSETPSKRGGLGRVFLLLGPTIGAILGYSMGYWIEDMGIFLPILFLGIFAGLIGFVACLIAGC